MPFMPATFDEFVADPRRMAQGVIERHMPRCDGGAWPPVGSIDALDRQKLEFLAAYYHLNRMHAELAVWRAHPARTDRHARELAILVREAMEYRDRLEDQYAPVGFDAEPELEGAFVVNLRFQHARLAVTENHRRLHPQEARVKVSLPSPEETASVADIPGIPLEEVLADLGLRRLEERRTTVQ